MRKVFLFVVFAIVSLSVKASYYDFEQDGIAYRIETDGLWVVNHYGNEVLLRDDKYKGDVVIPNTVTHEGIEYSVVGIYNWALYRSDVTSVTIPNSVTTIGDSAFGVCNGLTSVCVPNSVTLIGHLAFSGCSNLESVTIGNGVDSIGSSAFSLCSSLKYISIPDNVTKMGSGVFHRCDNLTTVTIGNGIKTIEDGTFDFCTRLTTVNLGNSVNTIKRAFFECTSLSSIVIPSGVTTIGNSVFEDLTSLSSVVLSNGLTSINNCAFRGCTSLQSIDIPNTVTYIGYRTFEGCTNLRTVNLGNSVAEIGDSFLSDCDSLLSVVSNNPIPPILKPMRLKRPSRVWLYVPKGSEEAYRNDSGWRQFWNIKAIGEDDNTDNTNTDDTTTDDNNTDDDKTDDGFSDGDSGWSINIKIKGEEIAQCSINNIESIEFTEDGLYIIINFKDGKSAKYDLSNFESIGFSENSNNNEGADDGNNDGSDGDNNEGTDGGNNESNPLTLQTSNGSTYVLLSGPMVSDDDNVNGNLADDATIYWYMTPQSSWSPQYVHILLDKQMSISDFPKGYDLGEPSINFGMVRSRENEYGYDSGSIKVTNNDGKSFTLEFNNYKASKSSGASITLNGSLYVEKERYY